MKFLRASRSFLLTRSFAASAVQLVALLIVGAVMFHFLGFWWCAAYCAGALLLISFAIDKERR